MRNLTIIIIIINAAREYNSDSKFRGHDRAVLFNFVFVCVMYVFNGQEGKIYSYLLVVLR